MKFDTYYINSLQQIVEDTNTDPAVQTGAIQQINNAMSMLGKMDDATLKKTGLDQKKQQLTDAVTQASVDALTKLHTVLSGSLGSSAALSV